jgi:hypothetical protein
MKKIVNFIILTFGLLACKQEAPLPEANKGSLLFTPGGSTLVSGKYTLTIPDGAVSSAAEFKIDESSLCSYVYSASDIYLFKCISTFTPQNISFKTPVTLTITEDKYWLRPVNALGLVQEYPVEKLRIYEINTFAGRATELPGARVQVNGDKISISGQIWQLGNYQIGIPRREIEFLGGRMEAVLSGQISKRLVLESYDTGSGAATQSSQYMSNKFSTTISMIADPKNPFENNVMSIFTTATTPGTHPVTNKTGENSSLIIYLENGVKYTVVPFSGEPATVVFTKYERPGGLVEGTYRTLGLVSPGDKVVRIAMSFSVRRLF